jgi:mono/diheme cytochrome c family protein
MHMAKALKWIGIGLGGLVGIIVLAALILSFVGNARLHKTLDIQPEALSIPTDQASLERGEHLVTIACTGCHGENLAGQPLLDDPSIGKIYSANLTSGQGGVGASHSDADLVRSIRHGVAPSGRHLAIMPADAFIHFSAEDLGAVIAYLRTVPPVDNPVPEPQLTFMGRVLLAAGMFGDVFPADTIDHSQPFAAMPEVGANPEYGGYLASFCKTCHGADLAGAQPADPASPFAPNLTPGGELVGWSEADFLQALHTGVTPTGRKLNPEFMPWESFGKFSDEELKGLWMYLQSLPATPTATQ